MDSSQLLLAGEQLASPFLLNYMTTMERRQPVPWQNELKITSSLINQASSMLFFHLPNFPLHLPGTDFCSSRRAVCLTQHWDKEVTTEGKKINHTKTTRKQPSTFVPKNWKFCFLNTRDEPSCPLAISWEQLMLPRPLNTRLSLIQTEIKSHYRLSASHTKHYGQTWTRHWIWQAQAGHSAMSEVEDDHLATHFAAQKWRRMSSLF